MVLRFVIGLAVLLSFAACEKRRSEAIVIGKEYIAAAAPGATPAPHGKTFARPNADEEITVDSYVMKRSVRGTGLDPRAMKHEQYLVKVRTSADGRTFNVPTNPTQFAKFKLGARVTVAYRVGKYTGTVWAAELID